MTVGLRSHYVASFHAAPLMIDNGRGLIVNTGHYGAVSYYHGAAYGAQKAGSDEMAADMAKELRPHNVAAVSIGAEFGAYLGITDIDSSGPCSLRYTLGGPPEPHPSLW
jgi:NAD(P)-dependent dehydrogenase (short-subunit alcohol dehydrogenase family)